MKMIIAKDISEVSAGVTSFGGKTGKIAKYSTLEECKDSYLNAEGLYEAQKEDIISVIRSTALRAAKELIMGAYWNAPLNKVPSDLVNGWFFFLEGIGEIDKDKNESRQTRRLMRFARVTETGRLKGVKVNIPNEAQLRILGDAIKKKTNKKADEISVALMYDKLAIKSNNSKIFNSAKDLATAYLEYKPEKPKPKKIKDSKDESEEVEEEVENIYVRDFFIDEVGECPERGLNTMALGTAVIKKLPNTDASSWKKWYHKASRCFHPDHGGNEDDMSTLISINEMISLVIDEAKKTDKADEWESDYNQWKKDRGYESDFIKEDKL